jgi:hypothetical protein
LSTSAEIPEPYRTVLIAILKYRDDPKNDGRLHVRHIGELRAFKINLGIVRASLNWLIGAQYLQLTEYDENQRETAPAARAFELTELGALYLHQVIKQNETDIQDFNTGLGREIRASLVTSLNCGIALVRASVPTPAQLEATLFTPLRWLVANFGKAALGELASKRCLSARVSFDAHGTHTPTRLA